MSTPRRTPAADAYDTHDKYWSDSGGDVALPVDPFEIAESLGIRVFATILGPNESGFIASDANGPVMFVNDSHPLVRQRFTCAHELGHYRDHQNRGIALEPSFRDERATHGTHVEEVYANRFAAALLMPKDLVKRLHRAGLTEDELARRFRVSAQAMQWRLRNLGLR